MPLLAAAGIVVTEDPEKTRKLILATNQPDVRVVLVRATDVPTYVQHGGADLGVAGKDVLIEHAAENEGAGGLYQPLDLQIAKCRMSVATRADFDYEAAVKQGSRIRVATKYTAVARQHFADKGVHVDLIKLYGSMELAPLTGLADAIVDLVSTGSTLKANKLVEVERIMEISSRLVVNQAALKLKRERIRALIAAFAGAMTHLLTFEDRTMPSSIRQLDTSASDFEAEFAKLRHWSEEADHAIEERVAAILADVKTRGDAAVLEYTKRFDGVDAPSVAALELTRDELKAAFDAITPAQRRVAAGRGRGTRGGGGRSACAGDLDGAAQDHQVVGRQPVGGRERARRHSVGRRDRPERLTPCHGVGHGSARGSRCREQGRARNE